MPMAAEDPTQSPEETDHEAKRPVVVPLSLRRAERRRQEETDQRDGLDTLEETDPLPWPRRARKVAQVSKVLGFAIPLCWIIGWPIGSMIASEQVTGVWGFRLGYSLDVILWALTAGIAIRMIGYVLSLALRLEASAQQLVTYQGARRDFPDSGPGSISALNDEIDTALSRLAEAESLIRQQVRAIGSAGEALNAGTARSAERLEQERSALIELTEEMNREADRFAERIAERSQVAANEQSGFEDRLAGHEEVFGQHLDRLETVSTKSIDRFEELARAMEERSAALKNASQEATEHQSSLTSRLEENAARIKAAQSELAEQSSKLESLMRDQRRRADRLAQVVTEQAGRVVPRQKAAAGPPEKPALPVEPGSPKQNASWKDILAKVENAKPAPLPRMDTSAEEPSAVSPAKPEPPAPENKRPESSAQQSASVQAAATPTVVTPKRTTEAGGNDMDALDRLVVRIQNYSLVLQTQLFGGPGHAELDRFEAGERQIFAKALMARDPDTLRARIQAELSQNAVFRERTSEFLRDFDTILEPLSSEAGGADTIQTYLTSPLGRLYMLTGSATGHFD